MDTSSLHDLIDTAVAIEAREHYLATYLDERAKARGKELGEDERREAIALFESYIRAVPELLAAAEASSKGTPVEELMAQVISAAVAYWDEPEDLVPDELGVLGLLDDAYFTMHMLQLVSDRLEDKAGHRLVDQDLSALDQIVCDVIGQELSAVLDDFVALSLSNAPVDELIHAIAEHTGNFEVRAKTPFSGRSVEDLVDAHLGFASYGLRPHDSAREALIDSLEMLAKTYAQGESSLEALRGEALALPLSKVEALVGVGVDAEDLEAVVNLLVGAIVQRVVVLGAAADREFVAHSVDLVLDGAGWTAASNGEDDAASAAS